MMAAAGDRLWVADASWRDRAINAGWRSADVRLAEWPIRFERPLDPPAAQTIAVFADVAPLEPPVALEEFSSHRLLWNAIADELLNDPYAIRGDAEAYLRQRQEKYAVEPVGLDRTLFLNRLIANAVAQGLVRRLISDKVPVALYGDGWEILPTFASRAKGQANSLSTLWTAMQSSRAILDVRPVSYRNALGSLGRPVVCTSGRTASAVRQDVASALAGRITWHPPIHPLMLELIQS